MNKSRILVVDSIPAFRAGIILWLNGELDLAGCGEADSVVSARTAMAELKPDLALLDLTLIDGEGLDLLREGVEKWPDVRTLVSTDLEEAVYAHRALRAGARGYITKREPREAVLAAVRAVLRGEIHISRSVTARLADRLFPDPASSIVELARLSDRELQVFQLLGSGSGTTEIAKKLRLSAKKVATYREHLKEKLQFQSGTALIRAATLWVEKGVVLPRAAEHPRECARMRQGFAAHGPQKYPQNSEAKAPPHDDRCRRRFDRAGE